MGIEVHDELKANVFCLHPRHQSGCSYCGAKHLCLNTFFNNNGLMSHEELIKDLVSRDIIRNCPECNGFLTRRYETENETGALLEWYQCTFCGYDERCDNGQQGDDG